MIKSGCRARAAGRVFARCAATCRAAAGQGAASHTSSFRFYSPATNARLVGLGVVPVPSSTPESFMQDVKADLERYAPIVKKANVSVE